MLNFTVDPRNGGPKNTSCSTCCCESINMQAGETNLVTLNYAPWSLPIGGPGIVPTFNYEITPNTSACNTASQGGFGPPNGEFRDLVAGAAQITDDLTGFVGPAGNTFTWSLEPLQGSFNGVAAVTAAGIFTYTANSGFVGHDIVWYRVTDAQGRYDIKSIRITVGAATGTHPANSQLLEPYIEPSRIVTDQRLQTVRFPLIMPVSAQPCQVFRLSIRQLAQDCDMNTFTHTSCYDIRNKTC